jgi:hypothetical protein
MADGWLREFDDPIQTPDGTLLHTLREAVAYLAKTVPKSERDLPAVTTAAEIWLFSTAPVWPRHRLHDPAVAVA